MMKPAISVLMPCYNSEQYIREAIDSILSQTFSDFEFIIINDGSTDHSEDIISSYNDPRIIYKKNDKNIGLVKTLNKGINIAKGRYIVRMDSDDISLPSRFQKLFSFMENNTEIGICGSWIEHFPNKKVDKNPLTPSYLDVLMHPSPFAHPSVIIRQDIIEKYDLFYDETYKNCEDYELWSRAIRYTKFANIPEILLKYREHPNSVSITKANEMKYLTIKVQKKMLDFLTEDKNLKEKLWNLLFKNNSQKYKISLLGIPVINIERK